MIGAPFQKSLRRLNQGVWDGLAEKLFTIEKRVRLFLCFFNRE
jgi:hypothetical protein